MYEHEDRIEGYDQPVRIDLKHNTIELLGSGSPRADHQGCMTLQKDGRCLRVEVGMQYMTGAQVDDATPLRRYVRIDRIISETQITES
jgi:hypothetical protein